MGKYPKFKLSQLLSFQLCRSTKPHSLPIIPLPKSTLSQVTSKSFDIAYPIIIPNPPPSTPNHDRNLVRSKIVPLDSGCQSRSCTACVVYDDYYEKDGVLLCDSYDGMITALPLAQLAFSRDLKGIDSSPASNGPSEKTSKDSINENNMKTMKINRRSKTGWKTSTTTGENLEGTMSNPSMIGGKMSEGFAVMKRSLNPYQDFKKSMLEMIMEKQIFEAIEMEQLLQCFLSLNSQQHYAIIVEAFTEIWENLLTQSSSYHLEEK